MARQYGSRGLRVAAIDATALISGASPGHDALVNAAADWQVNYPLLVDADSHVAHHFGVTKLPVVVLLAPDGRIYRRWDGFVRPAVLSEAIEQLAGGTMAH